MKGIDSVRRLMQKLRSKVEIQSNLRLPDFDLHSVYHTGHLC